MCVLFVLQACEHLRLYNTLMGVLGGLLLNDVSRLTRAWAVRLCCCDILSLWLAYHVLVTTER